MIDHFKQQVVVGRALHSSVACVLLLLFLYCLCQAASTSGRWRALLIAVCVPLFAGCIYELHVACEAWQSPALYLWKNTK